MDVLYRMVSSISSYMPYFFVTLAFTVLMIVGYILLMVRSSKKKAAKEAADKPEETPSPAEPVAEKSRKQKSRKAVKGGKLARSFSHAVSDLKSAIPGKDALYQVPWFLMLGETGCGKTTALNNLPLSLPLGKPIGDDFESRDGVHWWFYDKGVVLDVDGQYILDPQTLASDEKGWDTLIQLLKKHRPERPLDGVILTLSMEDFSGPREELNLRSMQAAEKAKILYNKLWTLQRATGICFPVYLLVTKSDQVTGFSSFANEIPVDQQNGIFGWSSPYGLDVNYTPEWADTALSELFMNTYQGQIELITDGIQVEDKDDFFIFPSEFEEVGHPLKIFLNHLFQESVYHDTFFFRGVYFTGNGNIETTSDQRPQPVPVSPPAVDEPPPLGPPGTDLEAPPLGPPGSDLEEPPLGPPGSPMGSPAGPQQGDGPETVPTFWAKTPPRLPAAPQPPLQEVAMPMPIKPAGKVVPFFLKDLFDTKIFNEKNLARPVEKRFLSLNRTIVIAQILLVLMVLVGGLGLITSFNNLTASKESLTPVLRRSLNDLHQAKVYIKKGGEAEHNFFNNSALNLLEGMTNINTNTFKSIFIPTSWFDTINEDIRRAMAVAYNRIILKSLYFELKEKTEDLLAESESFYPGSSDVPGNVVYLAQIPEFIQLKRTVAEFMDIERNAIMYNGLRSSKNLKDLGSVVNFLYGVELPAEFFTNAMLYHQALDKTTYKVFTPQEYKDRSIPMIQRIVARLYDQLFRANPLERQLQKLAYKIDQLRSGQIKSWPVSTTLREFQNVVDAIDREEDLLANPEYAWLTRTKLDLGSEYKHVLTAIQKSEFFGEELRSDIEDIGQNAFQILRGELTSKQASLTGPLLKKGTSFFNGQLASDPVSSKFKKELASKKSDLGFPGKNANPLSVRLELSPRVMNLKSALSNFLDQPFITLELPSKTFVTELPQGAQLFWDRKFLVEAADLYEQYVLFEQAGLVEFPALLKKLIQTVALKKLEQNMFRLVSQSQNYKPAEKGFSFIGLDGDIGPEVTNFKEASNHLGLLIDIFNKLDFIESSWSLSEVLTSQAGNLLHTVDQVLEEEGFYAYQEGTFAWWDGVSPVSLTAFEARNSKELEYYLDIQRTRIKHLATDYATPIIRFLVDRTMMEGSDTQPLMAKWQALIMELKRYDARKAGNSVTLLEKFILFDMDKIAPDQRCQSPALPEMRDPSGDFFLEKMFRLRSEILSQCKVLINDEVLTDYSVLEAYFNRNLAGKFPFAPVSLDQVFTEASPEAIREFYILLDEYKKNSMPLLEKSVRFGLSSEKALDFMDQMEEIRDFFSTFVGKGKANRQPQYALEIDFRVNQAFERGANQIIDWNLRVGQDQFNFRSPKRAVTWTYGDPIKLSLRWAKDSQYQPLDFTTANAKVTNRVVTYEFNNRWSLISLLRLYKSQPEDFERLVDPKPHTLKFEIGTSKRESVIESIQEAPDEEVWMRENLVRFFVRTVVMNREKNEIKFLPEFPVVAPGLKENYASARFRN